MYRFEVRGSSIICSWHLDLCAWVVLLLPYSIDVGGIDLVPCSHVFLHACCHAGLFAAGQGAAGLWDAFFEAVLLKFLKSKEKSVKQSVDRGVSVMARCAYFDEDSGVG